MSMIILGIESTAHTFGVGIVTDQGEVVANAKDSYTSKDKGMIPHEIADHHQEVAENVLKEALKTAKEKVKELLLAKKKPRCTILLLILGWCFLK